MNIDSIAIPPAAFHCEFEAVDRLVDVQGRISNDRIVYLLSKAANMHSDAMGWTLERYRQLGCWWVVRRHEVDYFAPADRGEIFICRTWPCALSRVSADRRHVLYRKSDGQVVAVGLNRWALVSVETGRLQRIPQILAKSFNPSNFPLP